MAKIGLTEHEKDAFSITRAVRALAFPQNRQYQRDAEFEFDVSTEAAKVEKRDVSGIFIPDDITQHKMINKRILTAGTDTAGGHTVDDELQSIIDIFLENNFAADNVTVMSGLKGNVFIPGQNDRIEAEFVGETEAATEDEPSLRDISLTPRNCKTWLRVSKQLLAQSHESVEMFLRRDLSRAIAKKVDKSILYGVGTAAQVDYDFDVATYAAVANLAAFDALTGKKWSFVTVSGTKYMIFKGLVSADSTALGLLNTGSKIVISASGGSEIETVTAASAYDAGKNRIAVTDYDTTGLANDTDYDIGAVTAAATFDPKGIVNSPNIHNYTWRNTNDDRAQDLIDRVLDMEEVLASNNVPGAGNQILDPVQNCKFLLSNRVRRFMKNVKFYGDNTEIPLLDDDEMLLEEYETDRSTQVNLGDFFFCDWKETVLGLWSGIEILENPYSEDTKGIVRICADQMLDVNILRPQSMSYAKVA